MGLAIIERTFTTKDIVDLVYPVGSIYMSAESTSPAEKWGGYVGTP